LPSVLRFLASCLHRLQTRLQTHTPKRS